MAGYIRQDTTDEIANGNTVDAVPLDAEFDAITAAFSSVGGHKHDGSTGEGGPIVVTGPAQDFVYSGSSLTPKTDNTYDLGSTTFEFKDLYIDGTANIDTLAADAGTVGGANIVTVSATQTLTNKTIDLTDNTLTGTSAELAAGISDETGTGSLVFATSPALAGTPTAPTAAADTNTTQIATTAHVFAERSNTATLTNKTISGGSISGITDLAVADGGTGASTAANARTNLGLVIGSDVQAFDAALTSIAGVSTVADQMLYTTGVDTFAATTVTSFARTLLDDASAGTALSTLGAQASDAGLTSIAALTTSADKMIYTTASDTYTTADLTSFARTLLDDANSTAARSTLGLGSMATQNSGSVSISGGTIAATFTGPLSGTASTATALATARTIGASGAATGTATSFDGTSDITIPFTSLNATNLTNEVPNASLPTRLQTLNGFVTDWDNATTSGFYSGTDTATNSPTAHYYSGVVSAPTAAIIIQTVFRVGTPTNNRVYTRVYSGGWSAWAEIAMYGSVQPLDATLTSLSGLSLVQGDILYASAADTLVRLPKGNTGEFLKSTSTVPTWFMRGVTTYVNQTSSGTDGDTIGTSWGTLNLTTPRVNQLGLTLSSNQITIPVAGNYRFTAYVPAYNASSGGRSTQIRLQNITSGTTSALGQVATGSAASGLGMYLDTSINVTAGHVFALQGISSGTLTPTHRAGSFGVEVGSSITIEALQ